MGNSVQLPCLAHIPVILRRAGGRRRICQSPPWQTLRLRSGWHRRSAVAAGN